MWQDDHDPIKMFWTKYHYCRVQRISEKALVLPSKRYSSYFDFHSSIFQSIQTESPKSVFLPPILVDYWS